MGWVVVMLIAGGLAFLGGVAHPLIFPSVVIATAAGFVFLAARRLGGGRGLAAKGLSLPALGVLAAVVGGVWAGRAIQASAEADAAQLATQDAAQARAEARRREQNAAAVLARAPELGAKLDAARTDLANGERVRATSALTEVEGELAKTRGTSSEAAPEVKALEERAVALRADVQLAARNEALGIASAALVAKGTPVVRAERLSSARDVLVALRDENDEVRSKAGEVKAALEELLKSVALLGAPPALARAKLEGTLDSRSTDKILVLQPRAGCVVYLPTSKGAVRAVYAVAENRLEGTISQEAAAELVRTALGSSAVVPRLSAPAGGAPRHSAVTVAQSKVSLGWVGNRLVELWVGEVEL